MNAMKQRNATASQFPPLAGVGRGAYSPIRGLPPLLAALLLGGCAAGASVTVDISVPKPLVEPINARMGVYLDGSLINYVHEEQLDEHGAYRIDIGASQAPVFGQVFEAMFTSVVPMVRATPAAEPGAAPVAFRSADGRDVIVDGVLAPIIEEVQFAIPAQTGGEFYEVWILYRMQLLDVAGNQFSEWPVVGYGKANRRNYKAIDQREIGLNEATIWALRDAAALLSFQFRGQAEVRNWLAEVEDRVP